MITNIQREHLMIHYLDDIAYASQHMDEQQQGGALGFAGTAAWNIAKFNILYKTLGMFRNLPKTGAYIPLTRGRGLR
jgi:hypothetical protein